MRVAVDHAVLRRWLAEGQLRPAALAELWGTTPCFSHPNTGQPYVARHGTQAEADYRSFIRETPNA